MYQFKYKGDELERFLIDEQLGVEFLIENAYPDPNKLTFFHHGDRMTVDLPSGVMEWEPIEPGSFTSSKLVMRFHQWFVKWIIKEIKEE